MIAAPARMVDPRYSERVRLAARVGVGNVATQEEPVDEPAGTTPFEFEVHEAAFTPSFMELYEHQYGAMVRLAVALTGSELAAEDVVQEAFVRVHARWDRIDLPTAYLRRAVVNACRSAGRRATRERTALGVQLAPVTSLEADELFDALATLPSRQRAALVLQFYEGLSQVEIADVLGCREGTVASLVHRGLAQLRRVIER
jgi:RNA polymerase sigma-70 factor (sigma-E family)